MADPGDSDFVYGHILVSIEPADFLYRHLHGLCGHAPQIIGGETLPPRSRRKVQHRLIHQSGRLDADPCAPIQPDPGSQEDRLSLDILAPFAFVEGMPGGVRRKNAPAVRTIKHEVTGELADYPPACLFNTFKERQITGEPNMTGSLNRNKGRISHLTNL
ncbi:protein of unknown function [Nitrospira japonica]|uniref:Uncharacterized protein n=1 Tax=Nitrospira japonica TaxID=1325564 RepID=A0A1W1IAZ0_9BACT|nr:protein of unknown function [Nitrospira japonica]